MSRITSAKDALRLAARGATENPAGRFERLQYEPDPDEQTDADRPVRTQLLRDASRSIITRNTSPDIPFNASLNPYRGCEHGCAYCYARPTHEYLGFSAGLDFETRIIVKEEAPELLRAELSRAGWQPQVLAMSGVTDPYQPVERRLNITRRCLEVLAEFRHPVSMITKNHLVTRDIDVLAALAEVNAAEVNLSITSLDDTLARLLEPRASRPSRRLAAVRELCSAGIPVRVMVAPVIPGLNDHELPAILAAAAEAGASTASFIPIRLPLVVAPLFEQWLERHYPDRRHKVLERIRSMRGGRLNDPAFGSRMHGTGAVADNIRSMFSVARRKAGLNESKPGLSSAAFRVPRAQLFLLKCEPFCPLL